MPAISSILYILDYLLYIYHSYIISINITCQMQRQGVKASYHQLLVRETVSNGVKHNGITMNVRPGIKVSLHNMHPHQGSGKGNGQIQNGTAAPHLNRTHHLHEMQQSRPPIMISSRQTIKIDRDRPMEVKYYSSDHYTQQRPNFRKQSKIIKYYQNGEVADQYGLRQVGTGAVHPVNQANSTHTIHPTHIHPHMNAQPADVRPAAYSQSQSNPNSTRNNPVVQQNRPPLPRIMNPGQVRVMQEVKRNSRINYEGNGRDVRSQTPPMRQNASAPHQQTPHPSKLNENRTHQIQQRQGHGQGQGQQPQIQYHIQSHPNTLQSQSDRLKSNSNSSKVKQISHQHKNENEYGEQQRDSHQQEQQQYYQHHHHPQQYYQQYSTVYPPTNVYPQQIMHPRSQLNGYQMRPISRHPSHISSPSSLGLALGSQNHHIQIEDIDLSSSPKESVNIKYNQSLQDNQPQYDQQQYNQQQYDQQQQYEQQQYDKQANTSRPPSSNPPIIRPPSEEYYKRGKDVDMFNKMITHSNMLIDQIYENQTHKALYRLLKLSQQPRRRK